MDTYSLEISTPQFLEQEIVLAQQFFAKLPRFEIERQGCFILESDTKQFLLVIIIAVTAPGIIDKPWLIAKTVLEMIGNEWQHVMIW